MHLPIYIAAPALVLVIAAWAYAYHILNAPTCRGCAKKVYSWQRHTAEYFGPPNEGARGSSAMPESIRNAFTTHLHEGCK